MELRKRRGPSEFRFSRNVEFYGSLNQRAAPIYKQLAATQPFMVGIRFLFRYYYRLADLQDRKILRSCRHYIGFMPAQTKNPDGTVSITWISTTFVSNTNPCAMRSMAPIRGVLGGRRRNIFFGPAMAGFRGRIRAVIAGGQDAIAVGYGDRCAA